MVKPLFSYRKFWAHRFGIAPFLPTTKEEMLDLGWESCDIIIITGDAYVDHPSFGMAILGRLLEAQGFRVGIISQPHWDSTEDFMKLGKPNLYFGITSGNMDSLVNHYTSDRKIRRNDAYTPNDIAGKRPDRAVIAYSQRAREAYHETPIIIGGIEASLRRVAHYDYWSDKICNSILLDSQADILLFGNAERAIVELSHRLASNEKITDMLTIRGTALNFPHSENHFGMKERDSTHFDQVGKIDEPINPYGIELGDHASAQQKEKTHDGERNCALEVPTKEDIIEARRAKRQDFYIRLPSSEAVKEKKALYAHASRILHLETNPYNARSLVQQHGDRDIWLNPPPIPLETNELDAVFDLPYARNPHPSYGNAKIPAWEMIKFSINIMRGCFGGCTFCSITEHEGRIIQNRSEESILNEVKEIRDRTKGFTGNISDLGGPTANMYRLACKDHTIERNCRRLSCVYPDICKNMNTDHSSLIHLYRKVREMDGIKRVFIASGVRYDIAVKSPEYVRELVTHHVGGYLKIAPEHTEEGPLSKMMKPSMQSYERFKLLFDKFSKEAGKEQYLIPYFIAAHPGTTDEDMLNLALWLKRHDFRADQVQAYLPTPMSLATAMYYSERNPLKILSRQSEQVATAKGERRRRLHKAFLRYHDPENWPLLREALHHMGHADLIGSRKEQLIPLQHAKRRELPKREIANPTQTTKHQKFTTKYIHNPKHRKKK